MGFKDKSFSILYMAIVHGTILESIAKFLRNLKFEVAEKRNVFSVLIKKLLIVTELGNSKLRINLRR